MSLLPYGDDSMNLMSFGTYGATDLPRVAQQFVMKCCKWWWWDRELKETCKMTGNEPGGDDVGAGLIRWNMELGWDELGSVTGRNFENAVMKFRLRVNYSAISHEVMERGGNWIRCSQPVTLPLTTYCGNVFHLRINKVQEERWHIYRRRRKALYSNWNKLIPLLTWLIELREIDVWWSWFSVMGGLLCSWSPTTWLIEEHDFESYPFWFELAFTVRWIIMKLIAVAFDKLGPIKRKLSMTRSNSVL